MRSIIALAAAAMLLAPTPVLAGTDKETPGAPCVPGGGVGTGNPCNGNNGNPSPEGNAQEKVHYDKHPDPFTIGRPGNDRGAYITQAGDQDNAAIHQTANTQYARIDQSGDQNDANVEQTGNGAHYALSSQTGDFNELDLAQSGAGVKVAFTEQTGDFNEMSLTQQGGTISSGVAATQLGDGNSMALFQSGDNNQARLTQDGSGNAMTASQTGGNNQLTWTQTGDNLSDLGISQTGGQALLVTQSR